MFFCNLEGQLKLEFGMHFGTQFWDAVADAKQPRHEGALSGVKASRARPMNEAESRTKEVSQGNNTTKKVRTLPDHAIASNLKAVPLKVNYGPAARTALIKVQQELAKKKFEQWVKSKLENTELREKPDALQMTVEAEDKEKPKRSGLI